MMLLSKCVVEIVKNQDSTKNKNLVGYQGVNSFGIKTPSSKASLIGPIMGTIKLEEGVR